MQNKVILITGVTSGVGRAATFECAKRGATVVMVARDRERGEAVRQAIIQQIGNANVHLLLADLAVQSSIRDLLAQFKTRFGQLDALVNNAAIFASHRRLTPDGLESMFATNHLGYFLLANGLLDSLKASGAGRILNLTAPSTTPLNFDDLQGEKHFNALTAFGASKMANLVFTFELARRLQGSGVTVNAVNPGLVRSHLMHEANPLIRLLAWIVSRSADKAAKQVAGLALSPQYAGMSGKFFGAGGETTPAAYALDPGNQKRLWEVSEQLTHMPLS